MQSEFNVNKINPDISRSFLDHLSKKDLNCKSPLKLQRLQLEISMHKEALRSTNDNRNIIHIQKADQILYKISRIFSVSEINDKNLEIRMFDDEIKELTEDPKKIDDLFYKLLYVEPAKLERLLKFSAEEQKNTKSQLILGRFYRKGNVDGIQQDLLNAVRYYKMAALQGSDEGWKELQEMTFGGVTAAILALENLIKAELEKYGLKEDDHAKIREKGISMFDYEGRQCLGQILMDYGLCKSLEG